MKILGARDWFVMVLTAFIWGASTLFIFWHASEANFVTWSGLCATVFGAYHWMIIRDQKVPDASSPQ